ncbi:8-amino-7-oxononanoate synthase [Marinomonas epiphytica]
MPNSPDWMTQALQQREEQGLLRQTVTLQTPQQTRINIAQRDYLAFCSNDYLGLANHPRIIKALQKGAQDHGVGGGASHLVCGHLSIHQALEEALADWLGYERVILFSTGYMANLAVISALADKHRPVIQDKLNHASLIDGAKLAGAAVRRYLHSDLESASKLLAKQSQPGLLVSDGVFSMDGDLAPLAGLASLSSAQDWLLMVDDAHGLGCLGESGRGSMEVCGLSSEHIPLLVGTFGKAFGTAGAFVATNNTCAEYLTQFARPYIYTTSMSPAMAAATLASLKLIQSDEGRQRRQQLRSNIAYFQKRMQGMSLELIESTTAIQPVLVGGAQAALDMSDQLKELGVWCTAIRPPTVPADTARLRITLSADHSLQDIDLLGDSLEQVLNSLAIYN